MKIHPLYWPVTLADDFANNWRCANKHGDAHSAHLAMNGECPWCGAITQGLADKLGWCRDKEPHSTHTHNRLRRKRRCPGVHP